METMYYITTWLHFFHMKSWEISYEIKDFELDKPEIPIDNVVFHKREKQIVGTVIINGDEGQAAIKEARQIIDRAVTKLSFIYERKHISIVNNIYVVDLANPSVTKVQGELILLFDVGMDRIQERRFSKLETFDPNKKDVLSKVLGLYRNALNSQNPFSAIETLFSCVEAVIKDMYSPNFELKDGLKDILTDRDKNFNEEEFYKKYGIYYGKRRCDSTHGNLDVSDHNIQEQGIIDLNEFKRWAWKVLDEFIIRNQN